MLEPSLHDAMDMLRLRIPDCRLVAFLDLSARLVLTVSAQRRPSQEALDALCAQAARLLSVAPPGLDLTGPLTQALALDRTELRLFLRSPDSADEALCLCARPGADHLALAKAAQALFSRVGDAV